MKKQELIQLHGLMNEISTHLTKEENIPTGVDSDDAREAYNGLNISPVAIHRSKDDHKDAILYLGGSVVNRIESVQSDEQTVTA